MSVEDRLAILDVIGRYSQAWDNKDPDAYAACFTEDGVVEVYVPSKVKPVQRHPSREAIWKWSHGRLTGGLADVRTRHIQTGLVFQELTAGAARTRSMLIETHVRPGDRSPHVYMTAVYEDEWRKTDEGWRLALRQIRVDIG